MKEYEIYLPVKMNDGTPVDPDQTRRIKEKLGEVFGGYTHLRQRSEGVWRMGGVTFRDEITIVRVLDDGSTNFDMKAFQKEMESALRQEKVLIITRDVSSL
jgi:hypothetical protein